MSLENANSFVQWLLKDVKARRKAADLSEGELVELAKENGYQLEAEHLNQVLDQLSDADLEKVSGGAYPTAVNSQITD